MNSLAPLDYQDSMLLAARGFLARHQSEHLEDDPQLITRLTDHMVGALGVKPRLAGRLAELAYSEWSSAKLHQCVDLGTNSSTSVEIYEPASGMSWSVPVHLIYEHIIAREGDSLSRSCIVL